MAYLSNNFKTNFYLYYILLKIVAKRIFDWWSCYRGWLICNIPKYDDIKQKHL